MVNFIRDWTQKEVETLAKSFGRKSLFIKFLKFVLPLLIVGMLGALLIYPATKKDAEKKIILVAQPIKNVVEEKPVMRNPRFKGMDSKGQAYTITAKQAMQEKPRELHMQEILADLSLNDGGWVSVVADTGTYNMDSTEVFLSGNVSVFLVDKDSKNYELKTQSAVIDTNEGTIKGDEAIVAESTIGKFSASSFVANKESGKISFKGPVNLVIMR